MRLGIHILRVLVGALFVGHGTQKLFGWFGGHGPEGTGQFMESLGLRPGKQNAIAAGAAETLGGLSFATGLAMPFGAAALTGTMTTAIATAHLGKGPWVSEGGWEYNAVLVAAVFAATEERSGLPWAIAQLAAGAAGGMTLKEFATRPVEEPQEQGVPFVRAEETYAEATEPAATTNGHG